VSETVVLPSYRARTHRASTAPSRARTLPRQHGLAQGKRLNEQRLRRSREIDVLEDERRRVARDLHDESGHRLTVVTLILDELVEKHDLNVELCDRLQFARRQILECTAGLHEVAFNLRPYILVDLGLIPAIRSFARRTQETTGLCTTVELQGAQYRLSERAELAAFRVVQEALTNTLKYAGASRVRICLAFTEDAVVLDVSDNGVGFDHGHLGDCRPRLGLKGIHERIELVGGTSRIDSQLGQGVTVWARIPRSEET
jgi:signal transduction histidine kinase